MLHTSETLERGRAAALSLSERIQEYESLSSTDDKPKSWNFPKAHSYFHIFDNVQNKGVTRNYNTKINENMHHPLKKAYQLRTNFKNIAPQVLHIDHQFYVAGIIHQGIEDMEAEKERRAIGEGVGDNVPTAEGPGTKLSDEHDVDEGVCFKVSVKRWTFEGLAAEHATDPAFTNFRVRLQNYLAGFIQMYRLPQPKSSSLRFKDADEIVHEYGMVKAYYNSKVDWTIMCDFIQASPSFYNNPRLDVVVIESRPWYFARLILLFTCQVESAEYLLALVQPLNVPQGHTTELERDMGLYRIRACPRREAIFIPARTIIRGAVAIRNYAADFSDGEEYFIMDNIDEDLFVRMESFQYR
ncbi:hypothetical protein AAF712_009167 [Marasmius tenuissimus]|uniref:Uncharacterized protein n=1 Tax=Marasmius tenuissimus TaxID=585030 RepID=A0ABR2ZS17_9AGAR